MTSDSDDIVGLVDRLAIEIASDYPNIENCFPKEQLFAIKQSYRGLKMANQDYYVLVEHLRHKLGMSAEECVKLSEQLRYNDYI